MARREPTSKARRPAAPSEVAEADSVDDDTGAGLVAGAVVVVLLSSCWWFEVVVGAAVVVVGRMVVVVVAPVVVVVAGLVVVVVLAFVVVVEPVVVVELALVVDVVVVDGPEVGAACRRSWRERTGAAPARCATRRHGDASSRRRSRGSTTARTRRSPRGTPRQDADPRRAEQADRHPVVDRERRRATGTGRRGGRVAHRRARVLRGSGGTCSRACRASRTRAPTAIPQLARNRCSRHERHRSVAARGLSSFVT